MTTKNPVALRLTYESLRNAIAEVPALGEEPINAILGRYLVLNVPQINKDGTVSKRAPKKFVVLDPERFNNRFEFAVKQQKRAFVPVILR